MDYEALSTNLTFDMCELRRCENVTIMDDNVVEQNESFIVTLGRTPGWDDRIALTTVTGMIQITDNDGGCCYATTIRFYKLTRTPNNGVNCRIYGICQNDNLFTHFYTIVCILVIQK